MYVIVRADLTPGLQIAQAIHAAVDFSLEHGARVRATPTVVALTVENEDELLEYTDILSGWCAPDVAAVKPHVLFHDEDLGAHTALATISDGREFSRLPLAGDYAVT